MDQVRFAALAASGTILAAIIALISFWWVNLRGPSIICSPIRYVAFARARSSSNIIPKFVLSNVGGSTAVVDFIYIILRHNSNTDNNYKFVSFYEGSIEEAAKRGEAAITNFDRPVLPFVIEKGAAVVKEITFIHDPGFDFMDGGYTLEMFISILQRPRFYHKLLNKIKCGKKEIRVLEQKLTINESLSIRDDGRMQFRQAMTIDPITEDMNI